MSASEDPPTPTQPSDPSPSEALDPGARPTLPSQGGDLLLDCPVFRVETCAHGGSGVWKPHRPKRQYFVIRAPDWVNVIALTPRDELVLVRQWRIGVQRSTLEVPGGVIDPGETPLEAAVRELREETGFEAERWHALGTLDPNPALQSNQCHVLLALTAEQQSQPHFDSDEHCETTLMPFPEVLGCIARGELNHSIVVAAVHFEVLRRAGHLHEGPALRFAQT